MALVTALLASCGKDPQEMEVRFSVLGDSYSAFEGYVYPEANAYYPHYLEIGVTQPEYMWWYKLANETGWKLERNNSYSGSMICNLNYAEQYGLHSFIRRMDNLGNPDVIFVFGGTNDAAYQAPLGEFVYADWTEEQLCTFRPALAYLLENLKTNYPNARLYLMIDMDLASGGVEEEVRDAFIESMHQLADYYQVRYIDLYNVHKDLWHPDVYGQDDIFRQVLKAIAFN